LSRLYFTDRDLGKKFPEILVQAGLTVERHQDLFPPDGSDEQWLEHCGTNNHVAISHNERIRYTPNELAAVHRHRVRLLIVVGHAPFAELARNFVNTLPKIEAFLGEHEAPCIAKVYRPAPAELARNPAATGTITLWHPK
jgi:hypothetical protein